MHLDCKDEDYHCPFYAQLDFETSHVVACREAVTQDSCSLAKLKSFHDIVQFMVAGKQFHVPVYGDFKV